MKFISQTQKINDMRFKYGNFLIFACFFLYTISMAAKGVFIAEQKYLVDLWNLEYATASMSNTFYFVTYGLVQVVLSFVMSKINVRKYMLWTVPFAGITTALIGLATNIYQIWIYFGFSGAFQASIYCGCFYMMTKYLPSKLLSKANTIMNMGYAIGSVMAYGTCAIFIGINAWQVPYFIYGVLFLIAVLLFGISVYKARRFTKINSRFDELELKQVQTNDPKSTTQSAPLFLLNTTKKRVLFYAIALFFAFFATSLYYAIMNYITSLLVDVHKMSQDVSVYVSIIAPIAITLGPILTIKSCDKRKDFIKVGLVYSLIILPIPALLALFYNANLILALALSVIFIVVVNGVKTVGLSVVGLDLRKQINTGSYIAIGNAIASISAGVTPTIIGQIIDTSGWAAAYWVVFGVISVIIVALIVVDTIVRKRYRINNGLDKKVKI